MTIVPMSTAPNMTSDAAFRNWGSAISNALAAIGWVKVTDAAQINWATVTKPAAANTAAGYEIWGMSDTLQATKPVYIKLEYGAGNVTTYPSLWLTVGTGYSNGALTGQVGARQQSTFAGITTVTPCYFSGAPSRLTACLWNVAAQLTLFLVERTHNGTGADTGDGIMWAWGSASYLYTQYVPSTGTVPPKYPNANCAVPTTGTGTYETNVYMWPVRGWAPWETCPFLGLAAYFNADIAAGQVVTATDWTGTARNFWALGKGGTPSYGTQAVWAVLYE